MVKHLILFRLKEKTPKSARQLMDAFAVLPEKIDEVQHLEVGEDFKTTPKSFDVALSVVEPRDVDSEDYGHRAVASATPSSCTPVCSISFLLLVCITASPSFLLLSTTVSIPLSIKAHA